MGSGLPSTNVKQSSTLLDVADNILLQGDGDLLTIHHEPNDVPGNELNACKEPLQDNNDTNNTMGAELLKTSREDVLTSVLSSSPSMQTVISRQEMLISDPLQEDDIDVDDKKPQVDSLEKEWI